MDYTGKAVVYKIINTANAKFYVGSTVRIKTRFRTHRRKLRSGTHHCLHLQNAWNKYGEDAFVFRVVAVVEDFSELSAVEQAFLDEHHGTRQCYNFARYTDHSTRGTIRPPKHRAAISNSLKAYYAEHSHPLKGVPRSDQTKALISANRAGKPVSQSTKEKIRQARLGTTASEETRAKLSAIRKGKERSTEHAAKYNKAVVEVTSGEIFPSLKAVKERFGMSPGSLADALLSDRPIKKGKNAGRHFRYT